MSDVLTVALVHELYARQWASRASSITASCSGLAIRLAIVPPNTNLLSPLVVSKNKIPVRRPDERALR